MKKWLPLLLAIVLMMTASIVSAEESKQHGIWELNAYVDEFNEPTDDKFVVSDKIYGTFSNSATNNSDLGVYIYCENTSFMSAGKIICIRLLEYDRYIVSNSSSSGRFYTITIKDSSDVKSTLSGFMGADSQDIYIFNNTDNETLLSALKAGGKIRFAISEDDSLTKYVFTINNADGFDECIDQL